MDMTEANPIYKRITRDSNGTRQRLIRRLAVGVPIALVGGVTLCVSQTQYNPLFGLITALTVVFLISSVIALPAAASAASATATQREVQGEEFELIRLTTLTSKEIASGLVEGMKVRLTPLRFAATSLLVLLFLFFLISTSVQTGYAITAIAVSYAPAVLVAAFAIWINDRLMTAAICGGVLIGVRFRKSPVGSASVPAGFLVAMIYLMGIGVAIFNPFVRGSNGGIVCAGVMAVFYVVFGIAGKQILLAGIEKNLGRYRV